MGLWTIKGGKPLYGTVQVQGAKNGALPVLAACLVHRGVSVLERVPRVTEVDRTLEILGKLGCAVKREGDLVTVDSTAASLDSMPLEDMKGLRSSVLLLGAMIARFGMGAVPIAVGRELGPRPVDLHIAALQSLGAAMYLEEGLLCCGRSTLRGGEVLLAYPSVGATENAMLAACGCEGETILRGCAKEPEVAALADYLSAAGYEISGGGTDTIRIRKGKRVQRVSMTLLPDRVAAATYLCAVAACGGKITLREVISSHLHPTLDLLEEMGCNIKIREDSVTLRSEGKLWAPSHEIVTGAYPEFPTDMQPAMLAACLQADGVSVFRERVFAGRLHHARQLRKFGADISLTEDCAAVVSGVPALQGAAVEARDLRGASALLIAGLQAQGITKMVDAGHIPGGFACLDGILRQLGADLEFTD